MTPLEELQAAHSRLVAIRDASSPGAWHVTASRDFRVEISAGEVAWDVAVDGEYNCSRLPVSEHDADLIIALHRTIDAQLKILQRAIDWYVEEALAYIGAEDLALARAINGEPS